MSESQLTAPPYSMRLDWDPDGQIFVVDVPELPGCMTHGKTYAEAVRNGEEAIASWLGASIAFGDAIPVPRVVQHRLAPTGDEK